MNTRDKRSSSIQVGLPWRGLFPAPDGSLNQGDRQHVCLMYRGIVAGAPGAQPPVAGFARLFDYPSHEVTAIDRPTHHLSVKDYAGHEVIVYDKDGK